MWYVWHERIDLMAHSLTMGTEICMFRFRLIEWRAMHKRSSSSKHIASCSSGKKISDIPNISLLRFKPNIQFNTPFSSMLYW